MLHHARSQHTLNYADIPLIDMMFGTFACPDSAPEEAGFWDGASQKLGRLLLLRPVSDTNPQSGVPGNIHS